MKIIIQIGIVFAICLVGEFIAKIIPFPFPSSVISMILLFLLLLSGILKTNHVQDKIDFLLKNMAFFFVPSCVSIINNYQYIKDSILPFTFICIFTTILTFAVTAYTVKFVILLQSGGKK